MLKTNYLRKFMDIVEKCLVPVQGVCIYASVAMIFVTVMARELFKISIVWGYEIACFFVIVLLFVGMGNNIHHDTNLKVSAVLDVCPPTAKKVLHIFHFFAISCVLVMMAIGFYQYMNKLGNVVLAASKFPNWLYYGAIGIGIALSALEMVAEILDLFIQKEPIQGVPENETPQIM